MNNLISIAYAQEYTEPLDTVDQLTFVLIVIAFIIISIRFYKKEKRKKDAREKKNRDELIKLRRFRKSHPSLTKEAAILKSSASTEVSQPKANKHIFISYRRNDGAYVTGRIYDRLVTEFGESSVFKDVDNIPLGVDFREFIDKYIDLTYVLLLIIGNNWMGKSDASKKRRIDDPNDFLRLEVAEALNKRIHIIPILVSGARMPQEDELPDDIKQLAFRNAIPVRHDPDFKNDMERLVKGLRKITNNK